MKSGVKKTSNMMEEIYQQFVREINRKIAKVLIGEPLE